MCYDNFQKTLCQPRHKRRTLSVKTLIPNQEGHIMKSAERITFIDSVRSLAILCVIMCHVVELVYLLFEYRLPPIGMVYKLLIFSAFTLGRLGVPFFLLITGYLLLSRSYMPKDILCFWKSKWLRLFLTTDLWIILFYVLPCITNKGDFHFFILMKQMLFLEPCSYSHMWYMPMVLGLYLFLPFVALVLQKIPAETLFFPGIMAFIWLFILPVANVLLTATEHSTVNSSLFLEFGGGIYGFYLILGFLVHQGVFRNIRGSLLFLTGILSFIGTVLLQVFSYHGPQPYNVWYDCGLLLICALCMFEVFSRTGGFLTKASTPQSEKNSPLQKLTQDLSKCTFGIYIIHNPILIMLMPHAQIFPKPISVIILFIAVLCISWFMVHVACKIQFIGRALFYIK